MSASYFSFYLRWLRTFCVSYVFLFQSTLCIFRVGVYLLRFAQCMLRGLVFVPSLLFFGSIAILFAPISFASPPN
jgi:hypothetical protein